ncbi:MAG: hypothetical protein ACPGXZ_14205 [Saprospiraceae bacterium]
MKNLILLAVFLFLTTVINAQSLFGPANTMGFGQIGVVASGNNYQSAYFQNPALLGRKQHEFDVFVNYNQASQLTNISSVTAGGMLTFKGNNAFGLGLDRLSLGNSQNTTFNITTIPLLYARNLYQSDWAGISVGANFNLINHRGDGSGFGVSNINASSISGGLGLDAYRVLSLSDNQFLRFNIAASTNNIGEDINDNNGYVVTVNDLTQVGTMVSWKYVLSSLESINFNLAYQLAGSFGRVSNIKNHHVGLEGRYTLEEQSIYAALRIGAIWSQFYYGTDYQYMTFGGTVNIKGFYVDFAVLPESLNGLNNVNIGFGYQKFLN